MHVVYQKYPDNIKTDPHALFDACLLSNMLICYYEAVVETRHKMFWIESFKNNDLSVIVRVYYYKGIIYYNANFRIMIEAYSSTQTGKNPYCATQTNVIN